MKKRPAPEREADREQHHAGDRGAQRLRAPAATPWLR
jgi:hypothetical protein